MIISLMMNAHAIIERRPPTVNIIICVYYLVSRWIGNKKTKLNISLWSTHSCLVMPRVFCVLVLLIFVHYYITCYWQLCSYNRISTIYNISSPFRFAETWDIIANNVQYLDHPFNASTSAPPRNHRSNHRAYQFNGQIDSLVGLNCYEACSYLHGNRAILFTDTLCPSV